MFLYVMYWHSVCICKRCINSFCLHLADDKCQVCFHNRHPFDARSSGDVISSEARARLLQKDSALRKVTVEKELESRALRTASVASANGDYVAARTARREANTHRTVAARARSEARELRPHHWTALVQPCASCGDYAARWRCAPCEESYCAGCYSRVHARGARLAHACHRLGYYTAEIHSRDERLFRANTRRLLEKSRREAARAAEPFKRNHSALVIQRTCRAAVGRAEGKILLQEAREARCAAQQQQKADLSRQSEMSFMFLDFLGRAPFLPSDGKEQLVLKRVAHWKCNPVMSFNVEV